MKLQTIVVPQKDEITLSHKHNVMLVGSCFTESIGEKMEYFGFRCMRNPFGILYNPFSSMAILLPMICKSITNRLRFVYSAACASILSVKAYERTH